MTDASVDLGLERLLDDARRSTGLDDFGGDAFVPSLTALLRTYDEAMGLGVRGKKVERRRLLGLLQNRLRITAALAKHPEIRERPIVRPVFLTGLPRTGTSALFNLLSADPTARPLLLWEGNHPDPLEGLAPGEEDPRLVQLRAMLERARAANPGFSAIHDARADKPEECVQLLSHSMGFVQNGVEPLFSPYRERFLEEDRSLVYDLYADLLRMVDWQRPGQRWLLKTPAHLWALDELLRLFPDATVVVTHRDPRECIPSYCSMARSLLIEAQGLDPKALGPVVVDYLAASVDAALDARARLPRERFVDVSYSDFVTAPVDTALRIHAAAGLPVDDSLRARFDAHVAAHPQNKHGKHDYGLEEFGLDETSVLDRFADETERLPRDVLDGPR